jgi:hypothetical protein
MRPERDFRCPEYSGFWREMGPQQRNCEASLWACPHNYRYLTAIPAVLLLTACFVMHLQLML